MSYAKMNIAADDPILQPLRIGPHVFPGIWAYTMPPELRGLRLPQERRATCMNCPKACYEGFRPDYRCCTYHPRIPNYLIGLASLTGPGAHAVASVLEKGMLLPEGMNHTPAQWIDYLDDMEHERFGASEAVLCPMLDRATGYCNVHAFRNSVCSTFFCYKDHGESGDRFWEQVQTLGAQVEMALSQWALERVGFDMKRYFRAFEALASDIPAVSSPTGWSKEALDLLWGDWKDKKLELMQACAQVVAESREVLWEIANTCEIHEAPRFNTEMVRSVPKRLKNQVDPEDLDDEIGEAARPSDLWKQCMRAYEKLWDLPDGVYQLSPRVEIVENPRNDAESNFSKDKPYCIRVYTRKGSRTLDWRMFIGKAECEVLELFMASSHLLDWRLLLDPKIKNLENGKGFLAEMLRLKVLVQEAVN